jgi:O-antigen/teichoic acid export membrane protein
MTAAEPPLRGSFASNIGGVAWTAAMVFAFTPLFIRRLGIEGYGVLDFGFAPTINRWLSRYSAGHEEPQRARDFAKTLEIGSWGVAIVVGALLVALSGTVARVWLGGAALRGALMLMAVTIVAQLPTTYYQSALLGLRRPMLMNVLKAAAATAANGGAAAIMILYLPSVEAYFGVQAGVAIVHALILRTAFWRTLSAPGAEPGRFRPDALRVAWRFTAGMTAITICAALVAQADRMILSGLVPLDEFGYYSVAWMIASGLAVVSLPALNTFFPRFSGLFASGDEAALRKGYHDAASLLSTLLLPLAAVVVSFAAPLVAAWTGNVAVAGKAAPIAALLTIGMAVNGLMIPLYALQLAAGATRLALQLTIAQIAVIAPLVTLLALRYGAPGAAFAWPTMSLLYFIAGSIVTFRRLLPHAGRAWLLRDVAAPLVPAVVCAAAARALLPLPASRIAVLAVIGVVFLGTLAVTAVASRAAAANL